MIREKKRRGVIAKKKALGAGGRERFQLATYFCSEGALHNFVPSRRFEHRGGGGVEGEKSFEGERAFGGGGPWQRASKDGGPPPQKEDKWGKEAPSRRGGKIQKKGHLAKGAFCVNRTNSAFNSGGGKKGKKKKPQAKICREKKIRQEEKESPSSSEKAKLDCLARKGAGSKEGSWNRQGTPARRFLKRRGKNP